MFRLKRVMWGESGEGIAKTTEIARKHGIKSMLKPHIWLRRSNGFWRSDIAMKSEKEWKTWFSNYTDAILTFARIAEENKMEALCIGTELRATVHRTSEWRHLIKSVRKVYSGQLTYAANWYKEFEEITFWDELDFIGIQAYFPLSDKKDPTVDDIINGWKSHIPAMKAIYKKFDKPIIFTELGYKNSVDAVKRTLGMASKRTPRSCWRSLRISYVK